MQELLFVALVLGGCCGPVLIFLLIGRAFSRRVDRRIEHSGEVSSRHSSVDEL